MHVVQAQERLQSKAEAAALGEKADRRALDDLQQMMERLITNESSQLHRTFDRDLQKVSTSSLCFGTLHNRSCDQLRDELKELFLSELEGRASEGVPVGSLEGAATYKSLMTGKLSPMQQDMVSALRVKEEQEPLHWRRGRG